MEQIHLHRDGEYAVVSLFRNEVWQEITRATFDVLREPHYVGAYENLPPAFVGYTVRKTAESDPWHTVRKRLSNYEERARKLLPDLATDAAVARVMEYLQVGEELIGRQAENQITPWDLFAAAALAGMDQTMSGVDTEIAARYADVMMELRGKRRGNE